MLSVAVKITEFTKFKDVRCLSLPFYNNLNKEWKLQLQVATVSAAGIYKTSLPNIIVGLVIDQMPPKQPARKFVVKLLNQISNNGHQSIVIPMNHIKQKGSIHHAKLKLLQTTTTCQLIKDDTLFFEVIKS